MSWAHRPNIETSEPSKAEGTECDESGLNLMLELGEAELCQVSGGAHVSGGVTEMGIVHRF
jgi:hypothetical protein